MRAARRPIHTILFSETFLLRNRLGLGLRTARPLRRLEEEE